MNIQSAIVVITSAGSTLGETLAAHFCELGAKVILCDQQQTRLTNTYELCLKISRDVHQFHISDYSKDSINQLFDFVSTTYAARQTC